MPHFGNFTPLPTRGEFTLLTNFSKKDKEAFQKAIEKYNSLDYEKYHLEIQRPSNELSDFGLWYKTNTSTSNGLSDFWIIYEIEELKWTQ